MEWDESRELIEGKTYYLRFVLYDSQNNEVTLTNEHKVNFRLNNDYFDIVKQQNQELVVKAKKLTQEGSLESIKGILLNQEGVLGVKIRTKVILLKPLSGEVHLPLLSGILKVQ